MSNFSSKTKYVEARPRREKKLGRGGSVVSVTASSGGGGVSKSYVDSNFVTIATEQAISGAKDFVGGIKVNGMPITYNAEKKYWEFAGDLIVSGAITMFGSSAGFVPSTIMDSVQVDGVTIVKNTAGQLQVIGGGGGTGGGISAAEVNILIENALKPYIKIETADDKYALISTVSGINSRLSAVETFFATEDSDTLINKWSEIVAFLNATEGDTLDNILATKANQSALDAAVASLTTEIGKKWTQNDAKISNWDSAYGWGNHANAGYAAKTYVDAELAKYVKLATAQKIDAQHNFVNGLQIGGLPITKSASANNTIYLDANLVVSGAITMFGSGSTTFPTIWADIPFNPDHMSWDGSQWNVIVEGGSGSGSLDTNAVNVLISEYLTQNSYATISDISSALVGYATQSWVGDNYLSQGGGTIEGDFGALDIKRNSNSSSLIKYSNTNGVLGYLGFLGANTPYFWDNSLTPIGLIHERNVKDFVQEYALPITGGTVNGNVTLSRLYTTEGVVLTNTGDSYSGLIPNSHITSGGQDKDFWLYNTDGAINHYATSYAFNRGNALFQGSIIAVGSISLGDDSESMLVMNRDYYNRFVAAKAGGRFAWRVNGQIDDVLILDESGYLRSPIGFVGNLTGNADSATQLQTPRTIWGQRFDGTDNLSGTLSQVSMIYFTGTDKGFYSGPTFGSHLTKNDVIIYGDVIGLYGDKVAVGATVADAKLHVHGTAILDEHTSIGTRLNIGNSSCMLRILTSRADRFSWVSGRLAEYSDFSIEYNEGSQYGLYGSIDYYTGDFAWQVGRSDGLDILRNLYLQPLGGNVAIGGTYANTLLHVHGRITAGDITANGSIEVGGYVSSFSGYTIDSLSETYCGLMPNRRISSAGDSRDLWLYNTHAISYEASSHTFWGDTTINGNLLATGAITMFSQASMKNIVNREGLSLEQLAVIEPVRFTWKDNRDSLVHAGGIADEVMQVLPEVVHRTKDDKLTMDYGSAGFFMAASLIKPVIDHEQRLQSAEKEIKDLREENKRLREQLRIA